MTNDMFCVEMEDVCVVAEFALALRPLIKIPFRMRICGKFELRLPIMLVASSVTFTPHRDISERL